MEQTRQILKSKIDDLKPIYLLFGEETYLIDEFVKNMINRFVDPEIRDFMLSYVKEEDEENFQNKLYEICNTVSMFSPNRIVVAYCSEGLTKDCDDANLLKLVDNFPIGTVLILISKSKPSKKLKSVKAIEKIGEIIEFVPLRDYNLNNWIKEQFARYGKKIAGQGISYLEENFLNNLQQLRSEIEKIITYVGDVEMVTLEDVQAIISKDAILKDTIIFDLVDAVGNRRTKDALMILEEMERDGEPLFLILKMFIRQMRLIMFSKEMHDRGFPPEDTAKRLKQHPFPIKKCYSQSRNFTMEQLELALERMLQANYDIVTGRYPEKLALQLALIDLKESI